MIEIRRTADGFWTWGVAGNCTSVLEWFTPDAALRQAWFVLGGHVPALVYV